MEHLVLVAPLTVIAVGVAAYFFSKKNTITPTPTPVPSPSPVILPTPSPAPVVGPTGSGPLVVTVNTSFITGTGTTSATTTAAFVTVSGGSGNYTYLWKQVSGSPLGLNGNLTPTVTAQFGGSAGVYTAGVQCDVTDSTLNITGSSSVVQSQITLTL